MIEESTRTQDVVESILHIAWPIPLWLIGILVLFAMLFVTLLYHSERGRANTTIRWMLAGLRLTLLLMVLWMLTGWSWLRFKSDQPELIIVLDRSASMSTQDVGTKNSTSKQSRFERALSIFESSNRRERQNLLQHYRLEWFMVSESLEQATWDFGGDTKFSRDRAVDGNESRLGDGLIRLIQRQAGKGTAAIVFISDGINTTGATLGEAAKAARRSAIPIVAVSVGRQQELPDLRLADLLIDRDVYLGDQVTIEVSVIASDVSSADTRIVVRDLSNDKVIDETQLTISPQQRQAMARLSFVPQRAGDMTLRIAAEPIAGEEELNNNFIDAVVRVQDKTIRTLLVSDVPSYEFRFLKNFLERATQTGAETLSSFQLSTVLQDADPLFVDQDKSALRLVPSKPELIDEYDVFVFLDFDPQLISQTAQQAIFDAVTQRGAGCIFISSGPNLARRLDSWPLSKLLPVERAAQMSVGAQALQGRLAWQPSMLGGNALPMQLASTVQESLSVWQKLPEFAALGTTEQVRAGAQVICNAVDRQSGQTAPLLITQYAGAGRTAFQASDETYRWSSFLGSDLYYQRYWGQTLRWLSRGKLSGNANPIELLVEPKQVTFGQPVQFQVKLNGQSSAVEATDSVEIALESNGRRNKTLKLLRAGQASSVYQTSISDLKAGSYRALLVRPITDAPPSEDFVITAPPGEQASLRANVDGLQELAEQSRGRFYLEEHASRLFAELPTGKPTRLGALPSIPLWNSWWIALLFVTLITTEWIFRRKFQML